MTPYLETKFVFPLNLSKNLSLTLLTKSDLDLSLLATSIKLEETYQSNYNKKKFHYYYFDKNIHFRFC